MPTSPAVSRRRILSAAGALAAIPSAGIAQTASPAITLGRFSRALLHSASADAIEFGEALRVGKFSAIQFDRAQRGLSLVIAHIEEVGANDSAPALIAQELTRRPDLLNPSREALRETLANYPDIAADRVTALYIPGNITFADAAEAFTPGGLRAVQNRALATFASRTASRPRTVLPAGDVTPPKPARPPQPRPGADPTQAAQLGASGIMVTAGSVLTGLGFGIVSTPTLAAYATVGWALMGTGVGIVIAGVIVAGYVTYQTMPTAPMDSQSFDAPLRGYVMLEA
jgi:hypothetical protein